MVTVLLLLLVFSSCRKDYSCEECENNRRPIARAGQDQTIYLPLDSVTLNGGASVDLDGSINNYFWKKVSGPERFSFVQQRAAGTVVKNLAKGVYHFELNVTDDGGLVGKDTVRIVVVPVTLVNDPPMAKAGFDQTIVFPENAVVLDGSNSSDPNNNISSYQWTSVSGPSGFKFEDARAAKTRISNLNMGIYQFVLKVTDREGLFSKDTVKISVLDGKPQGDQFIFDNLLWETSDFYNLGITNVYVGTPSREDIFINTPGLSHNVTLRGEVYLKFENTDTWIHVKSAALYENTSTTQYLYEIISPNLFIHIYPANPSLVGTKASIKVILY